MKELYIRKGNFESNRDILIIGEESNLGGRDSAYRAKGTLHDKFLVKRDPFSGAENLAYIHACENILLSSENFSRDYGVHKYLKSFCKDLLKWDGEANQGYTDSREAFIVKNGDVNKTVKIIRARILSLVDPDGVFQKLKSRHIYKKTQSYKRKRHRRFFRLKWRFKLIIALVLSAFFLGRIVVRDVRLKIDSINYDYRNRMSDENDEWLFDKCLHIICENGGKAEWLDEAYYSTRFAFIETHKVHVYGDYTVIRIKSGLSVSREQTAINSACNKVLQKHGL